MATYGSFSHAIPTLMSRLIKNHQVIKPFTWQSMDVSQRKEATLLERWGDSFEVVCLSDELQHYRDDIHPNLPWADNHFASLWQKAFASQPGLGLNDGCVCVDCHVHPPIS